MAGDAAGPVDATVDGAEVSVGAVATTSEGTDGPSMAFLRELAHVSEQPPNPFELELGRAAGSPAAGSAPASRRFAIRRRLGAGGFGTVYEAFDHDERTAVALKVLRRPDGPSIARFKREFRALAETGHPNLVQLYELHAEGEAWFFTMELVHGGSALAYVRPPGGACDLPRLRAVFGQLADGLAFLHRAGKLHRDLKPSNVMVTAEGRVVIVDFGLTRTVDELVTTSASFGTPAYMPPEQLAGQPVGPAGDWYAVGVMLHEALTGRLPLRPGAVPASGVPALDRLCAELLAREPAQRPSGAEVRQRLADALPLAATSAADDAVGQRAPPGGEVPFIGRVAHLAALHAAAAAVEHGTATVVLVHGRSGLGKSALLRRFVVERRALAPGRLVLAGRCFAQESVPYKGVDGLIDDLARQLRVAAPPTRALPAALPLLTRVFPQLRGIGGVPGASAVGGVDHLAARKRVVAALGELLAWAAPSPATLVVDDLQWGDVDSAALLAALLHGPVPVLVVASDRTDDASVNPVIDALRVALDAHPGRVDVRDLDVGPLEDREADAVARALLAVADDVEDAATAARVHALVAEAHGDPSLLAELVRYDPAGPPRSGPDPSRAGTAAGGRELGALLAARIGGLPGPARCLLEVVALDGQPLARAVAAAAACGRDAEAQALSAIGVLRAARLIRSRRTDDGDELLPYHDRIRAVVTSRLDPVTRRAHHHRLALALAAVDGTEPERLAYHYHRAGRLRIAAVHAAAAARRAHDVLAFERAARLYRDALAFGAAPNQHDGDGDGDGPRPSPAEERALRVALAEALAGAGRPREAAAAYLEAAAGADPAAMLGLRTRAAEHLLGAGYADEGLATVRGVLRDVGVTLATSLPGSLIGCAALRVRLGVRGLGFRERAERTIDRRELLRIDACFAAALGLFLVNPVLAAEPLTRHLLFALDAGEPARVARALAFEAVLQAHLRGPGPATDRLAATARAIEAREVRPRLSGTLRLSEGLVAQVSAQWRLVHDRTVESEAALRAGGAGLSTELDLARFTRIHTLWMLGDVVGLARLGPALMEEAHERGNRFLEMMVRLTCEPIIALAADRPDRARTAVAAALARWPHPPGSFLHVREALATARIALYERRGPAALAAITAGLSAIRRTGLILARAQTSELRLLQALAALSVGDDAGADRARRALARSAVPWAHATAVIVEAGLARRRGDLAGAVALLARARRTARDRGTALIEMATSRRIGQWRGGAEGRAEIATAEAWMAGQGIVDAERTTALLLGWA